MDDEPSIGAVLRIALEAEGYAVELASDGVAALERVRACAPDLVLLDLDMPRLSGDEVCRRLKADPATRLIPVAMITGRAAYGRIAAWNNGADEYLTKPFHLMEVMARCRSLLRIKRLVEERDSAEAVVFAMARAVEAKSAFTAGHAERVTRYCLRLADRLVIGPDDRELLRKGALLHDIGKISIPDAILDKPGRLIPEEFDVIKTHPVQGAHIVAPLASVRDTVPLIRWHHERPDGKGYPDGLGGSDIPLLVRILSVCDVYDSLASDRPYRSSMPDGACRDILRDLGDKGGLDPGLVKEFFAALGPERIPGGLEASMAPVGLVRETN